MFPANDGELSDSGEEEEKDFYFSDDWLDLELKCLFTDSPPPQKLLI